MKVIGIVSSPSYHGNTAILVREALKGAQDNGAEIEEIFLPNCSLEFCQGCMSCLAQGRCALKDDLEDLKHKIAESEGIVLGSPTHALAPNALMKNVLDRIGIHAVYTGAWAGKYVVGISTAGGFGAKGTAKQLTGLVDSVFGRGYVSGTLGLNRGWHRIEEYPNQLKKAYQLGQKITTDIRQKRSYPFQHLFGRIFGQLVLKRVFIRNVLDHKDREMKAVYQRLVERGELK